MAATKKKYTKRKRYKVIIKVPCTAKCYDKKCVNCNRNFKKFNCDNLLSLVRFLDTDYPTWRWFNVFKYVGKGLKGPQIGNFTQSNRPTRPRIYL